MATLLGGFFPPLLLCAVCWAQSSGGLQQSSAKEDPSKPSVKEMARPVAAEAEPDAKASETKDGIRASNIRLTAVETVVSKTETAAGFGELSCDSDGNLYLAPGVHGDAIRKINAKGELVASFQPEANPDVQVLGVGRYTVTPEGEVYVPVGTKGSFYWHILVFKADGSYSTNFALDVPIVPATIAVFSNGSLLMTGTKLDRTSKLFIVPFTGIFRSDGKLLKEITLEQEEHLPDSSAMRNLQPGQRVPPITNRAVSWGQTEPANDGNIYIMRWGSPAAFYAISPGGEVVKHFNVDPGASYYDPEQMRIAGNRIALSFRHGNDFHDRTMKIVDLEGQELATYDISPTDTPKSEHLGIFACYSLSPEHFTFLTAVGADRRIELKQVEPH